jgi:hypothetical protein
MALNIGRLFGRGRENPQPENIVILDNDGETEVARFAPGTTVDAQGITSPRDPASGQATGITAMDDWEARAVAEGAGPAAFESQTRPHADGIVSPRDMASGQATGITAMDDWETPVALDSGDQSAASDVPEAAVTTSEGDTATHERSMAPNEPLNMLNNKNPELTRYENMVSDHPAGEAAGLYTGVNDGSLLGVTEYGDARNLPGIKVEIGAAGLTSQTQPHADGLILDATGQGITDHFAELIVDRAAAPIDKSTPLLLRDDPSQQGVTEDMAEIVLNAQDPGSGETARMLSDPGPGQLSGLHFEDSVRTAPGALDAGFSISDDIGGNSPQPEGILPYMEQSNIIEEIPIPSVQENAQGFRPEVDDEVLLARQPLGLKTDSEVTDYAEGGTTNVSVGGFGGGVDERQGLYSANLGGGLLGATADHPLGDDLGVADAFTVKHSIKGEMPDTLASKWELSEFDASKNEVSIETLEVAHEGINDQTPADWNERSAPGIDVWEHAATSNVAEVETAIPAIIQKGGDIGTNEGSHILDNYVEIQVVGDQPGGGEQAMQDVFVTELRTPRADGLKTEWITSAQEPTAPESDVSELTLASSSVLQKDDVTATFLQDPGDVHEAPAAQEVPYGIDLVRDDGPSTLLGNTGALAASDATVDDISFEFHPLHSGVHDADVDGDGIPDDFDDDFDDLDLLD